MGGESDMCSQRMRELFKNSTQFPWSCRLDIWKLEKQLLGDDWSASSPASSPGHKKARMGFHRKNRLFLDTQHLIS